MRSVEGCEKGKKTSACEKVAPASTGTPEPALASRQAEAAQQQQQPLGGGAGGGGGKQCNSKPMEPKREEP